MQLSAQRYPNVLGGVENIRKYVICIQLMLTEEHTHTTRMGLPNKCYGLFLFCIEQVQLEINYILAYSTCTRRTMLTYRFD